MDDSEHVNVIGAFVCNVLVKIENQDNAYIILEFPESVTLTVKNNKKVMGLFY